MRTCAVEEELLLVDPQGGQLLPPAAEAPRTVTSGSLTS